MPRVVVSRRKGFIKGRHRPLAREHARDVHDTMAASSMTAFVCSASQVGRQHDVAHGEQGGMYAGFIFENIQSSARQMAGLEGGDQGGFIHDPTAGRVDEAGSAFHPGKARGADETVRVVIERKMQGNDIRGLQQRVE